MVDGDASLVTPAKLNGPRIAEVIRNLSKEKTLPECSAGITIEDASLVATIAMFDIEWHYPSSQL